MLQLMISKQFAGLDGIYKAIMQIKHTPYVHKDMEHFIFVLQILARTLKLV